MVNLPHYNKEVIANNQHCVSPSDIIACAIEAHNIYWGGKKCCVTPQLGNNNNGGGGEQWHCFPILRIPSLKA